MNFNSACATPGIDPAVSFVPDNLNHMPAVHLLIKGRVQGVFYRASAKNMADSLGITGWVRNTEEGDVEIFASGTEEGIGAYTHWCRQGPPRAIVTSLVVTPKEEQTVFKSFEVLRT